MVVPRLLLVVVVGAAGRWWWHWQRRRWGQVLTEHLLPPLDLVLDEGPAGQLHRLRHLGVVVVVAVLDVLLEPQRVRAGGELGVGAGAGALGASA